MRRQWQSNGDALVIAQSQCMAAAMMRSAVKRLLDCAPADWIWWLARSCGSLAWMFLRSTQ
jgi:hypothetical protein